MIMPNPERKSKKTVSTRKTRLHLTDRQRAFFKCLEKEQYNINRAMTLLKIKDWLMDRWFRDPLFVSTLKNRYRQIEFRTHMELTYHLPMAAMNLVNMTNGFDTETMLKACSSILRFHNNGRTFHEYAFIPRDRPLPLTRTQRKDRKFLDKPRPKDPALALSRRYLDETDADQYKHEMRVWAECEQRRLQKEAPKQPVGGTEALSAQTPPAFQQPAGRDSDLPTPAPTGQGVTRSSASDVPVPENS